MYWQYTWRKLQIRVISVARLPLDASFPASTWIETIRYVRNRRSVTISWLRLPFDMQKASYVLRWQKFHAYAALSPVDQSGWTNINISRHYMQNHEFSGGSKDFYVIIRILVKSALLCMEGKNADRSCGSRGFYIMARSSSSATIQF